MTTTIQSRGKLKFLPYRNAADEYMARLRHYLTIREIEVKSATSPKLTEFQIRETESRQLMANITNATHLFVLDERGKMFDSVSFATKIGQIIDKSQDFAFAIGGASGHHDCIRQRANTLLAFSPMTFPHELARVMIYEQLYRAMTILKNEPYHKV